jgi:hypothetical protein
MLVRHDVTPHFALTVPNILTANPTLIWISHCPLTADRRENLATYSNFSPRAACAASFGNHRRR